VFATTAGKFHSSVTLEGSSASTRLVSIIVNLGTSDIHLKGYLG
jgi:hypothetical protein